MQIFLWSCKSVTCLQAATYNFLVRTPGRVPGLMTSGIMTSQDDMSISKLISKVLENRTEPSSAHLRFSSRPSDPTKATRPVVRESSCGS